MEQYRNGLDEGKPQARAALGLIGNRYTRRLDAYLGADWESVKTVSTWHACGPWGRPLRLIHTDWNLHPRGVGHHATREKMVNGDLALDWGCAENLAYASLVQDGFPDPADGTG